MPHHHRYHSYTNGEITVLWQPDKCLHAGHCRTRLPEVFDARSDLGIDMKAADSRKIVETILHCPSGALSYTLNEKHKPQIILLSQQESIPQ